MARFNEILVGRYNRFIQKLLSMKGSATLVTVSDEMMPVFPFYNGVEHRYLEGWQRFGMRVAPPAVAGQNAAAQLRNLPGSNIIAVVESVVVFNTLADNPSIFAGGVWTTDLATPQTTGALDLRQGASVQSGLKASTGANAVIGGGQGASVRGCGFVANGSQEFILTENQEMPILPGSGLAVWSNVVNQLLQISFVWRERFLEDSERS